MESRTNFDLGLYNACFNGHKELILLMLEIGASDMKDALFYACSGGQKETVSFILNENESKNLGFNKEDFEKGLRGACRGGFKDLALVMIKKGANDWESAFYGSCSYGNPEFSLWNFQQGIKLKNFNKEDLDNGLDIACKNKNKDLALLLIDQGKHFKFLSDENINLFNNTFGQ